MKCKFGVNFVWRQSFPYFGAWILMAKCVIMMSPHTLEHKKETPRTVTVLGA